MHKLDTNKLLSIAQFKWAIIAICLLMCPFLLWAEDSDALTERIIADIYEQVAEDAEEEIDYTTFFDDLMAVVQSPINLNFATREELKKIRFLSDMQIENILLYVYHNKGMCTIYELRLVEGLSANEVNNLLPFVYIDTTYKKKDTYTLKEVFRYGKHEMQLRIDRAIETKEGYQFIPEEELEEDENASAYQGDPFYTYLKYRFRYSSKVYAGISAEKDAGEQFAWNEKTKGADFYGAYAQVNDIWKFKTINIGDFQANFGQGLVLQSSFGFGKSSYVLNVAKSENGFKKSGGTNEFSFMRGAAATARLGKFDVSAFYSNKMIDGEPQNNIFNSIYKTGLHRTELELEKKQTINQQIMGGNVTFTHNKFQVGLTTVNTILSDTLSPEATIYNANYFRGKQQLTAGLNYRLWLRKFLLFGEAAMTDNVGVATVNGVSFSPISKLGFVLLHRYYSPKFDNFHANAFSETSRINNEQGFYIGTEMRPIKYWKFAFYADAYTFKYPKFGIDKPTAGFDYMLQADYVPNRTTKMYWRTKWERKGKNISDENVYHIASQVGEIDKASMRYHLTYQFGEFTFKNIVEANIAKLTVAEPTYGISLSQDVSYVPSEIPIRFDFRFHVFDAQNFENRFYSYEKDVLYAFSIPMYYGLGARYYVNMKYEINRSLALWFKIAQTTYADDRESVSSGNEAIEGNRKTDVRFMCRWKF